MLELFSGSAAIIACLIIGTLLIVVEALTPGLGLPGLMGGLLLTGGSVLMWNRFGLTAGLITLLCSLLFTGAAVLLSIRSAAKGRLSRTNLVLDAREETPEKADKSAFIGLSGEAATPLNPLGTVLCGEKRLEAYSSEGFIPKGTPVTVICVQDGKLYVSKSK